jgi:hypothetical protein
MESSHTIIIIKSNTLYVHPQGTWQVSIVVPRGNVIDNMDEKIIQVNVKF